VAKQLRQSIVRKPVASRRVDASAAKDDTTGSGARPSPNNASMSKRIDPEKGHGDGIAVGKTNRRELLHAMISVSSKTKTVQEVEQLTDLCESERSQLMKTIANLESQNARCITEAQEAKAAEAILALASQNTFTATNDEAVVDLMNNDAAVAPDRTDNETAAEEVAAPDQVDAAAATDLRRLFTAGNESTKSKHDGNKKADLVELPSGHMLRAPCLCEANSKKNITKLKKLAETGSKLDNGLNHGRFKGAELAKQLLAAGLAHAPQLTQSAGEMIVPCMISSFLADCGITANPAKAATVSPGKRTLGEVIKECGIELVHGSREKLEPVEWFFLSCDKGNKSNNNFFVKIHCWWNEADKKVEQTILDVDAADGKSVDAAKSIEASLCEVECQEGGKRKRRKLAGGATDAGGGGTFSSNADGGSMARELRAIDRALEGFLSATCSLHGLQRALACPVKELRGTGGLQKNDFLQFLFTACNLQKQCEDKEWKMTWVSVVGKQVENMETPALSRWWHVGEGAKHLLLHWDEWKAMAQSIINAKGCDSTKNETASWLDRCTHVVPLKARRVFIVNFHVLFF
jgi:hypothetical protein